MKATHFQIKVHQGLENLLKKIPGRIIIAAFASHLTRLMHVIKTAEALGKKVVLDGRSMKGNIEVVMEAGLFTPKKDTLIPIEDIDKYPPNKIVILMTGAQGEEFAALGRIANNTHRYIKISPRDTFLMSSATIPGIRRPLQGVKDKISREDAHLAEYKTSDVHSSGHAHADELLWIHRKIGPTFFIPIHGYHYMLRVHADLKRKLGLGDESIVVPDNGMIIEISNEGRTITSLKEKAPSEMIVVDGTSVGKVQDVVMRDRQTLAEDGMFVVIGVIDSHTHTLKKSPDLISRGFIYLKENQELLRAARHIIKKTVEDGVAGQNPVNFDYVKTQLGDNISKFLFQKTAKRPLVIPVVLSV